MAFFVSKYRQKSQVRFIHKYMKCIICDTKFFSAITFLMIDCVSYRLPCESRYVASYALHHGVPQMRMYAAAVCLLLDLRTVTAVMTWMVFKFLLCDCSQ